jgi:C4-dicarboxylate transporter DctM subunit
MYIIIAVFVVCLFLGMPIVFTIGIPGVLYLITKGMPLVLIPQKMFTGTGVFVLLALPMFILAGELMNRSGISKRLVRFAMSLVGFLPGGLAMVNIVTSMFFAGITGAATADTSAVGSILIPAMKKEGYDDGFTAAVTAVSSTVGPIIPPSILFVVYGSFTNVSIGKLFLGGLIPGVLIVVALMIVAFIISKNRGYPKAASISLKNIVKEFKGAFWALIIPVLIVVGMGFGVMTATEVSVMSVILALIIGLFVYREMKLPDIPKIIIKAGILSGSVMFIVATNNILLYAVTLEQVADKIGVVFFMITQNKVLILLLINVILLFFGALVDTLPLMLLFIPVLTPIFAQLGMNPVQAGVMVVLNMTIGLSTPPVGCCLFIASSIAKTNMETISKAVVPFLIAVVVVLMLVTYFPPVSLLIPDLFMK